MPKIWLYGACSSDEAQEFKAEVSSLWQDVDTAEPLVVEPFVEGSGARADVHLFFHDPAVATPASPDPELDALAAALAAKAMVFPVVATAPEAGSLPAAIQTVNAFIRERHPGYWSTALACEVLTRLVLPRPIPRLFVSYRRCDSTEVAAQLSEKFVGLGYRRFLDVASIPPGEVFQEELRWWLNDADLVVFLASPRVDSSGFVREEIELARTAHIGMLVVQWPDDCYPLDARGRPVRPRLGRSFDPDAVVTLTRADLGIADDVSPADLRAQYDPNNLSHFARHDLTVEALDLVVARALRQRVKAVVERRIDLEGLVGFDVDNEGGTWSPVAGEPGRLLVTDNAGKQHSAYVHPCRPDAVALRQAARSGSPKHRTVVHYLEVAPNDRRARSLKWLADRPELRLDPMWDAMP